jgi:hypothetical protein
VFDLEVHAPRKVDAERWTRLELPDQLRYSCRLLCDVMLHWATTEPSSSSFFLKVCSFAYSIAAMARLLAYQPLSRGVLQRDTPATASRAPGESREWQDADNITHLATVTTELFGVYRQQGGSPSRTRAHLKQQRQQQQQPQQAPFLAMHVQCGSDSSAGICEGD